MHLLITSASDALNDTRGTLLSHHKSPPSLALEKQGRQRVYLSIFLSIRVPRLSVPINTAVRALPHRVSVLVPTPPSLFLLAPPFSLSLSLLIL